MNVYKYNRNHVPELLCNLYAMYKNGECCDVTLKCSDGAVKAPGIILAAICPVLRQLGEYLTAEMDVNVLLPDFNENDISSFLNQLMLPQQIPIQDISVFNGILQFFQKESYHKENSSTFDCSIGKILSKEEPIDNHDDGVINDDSLNTNDIIEPNDDVQKNETEPNNECKNELNSDLFFEEFDIPFKHKRKNKIFKSKSSKKVSLEAKRTFNEDLGLYICPHCNLQLKAGMTNHLKWHKEHPDDIYPSRSTCESCGKTFKKIGILRAHIMRMHSNLPKKFVCTFEGCDKAFKMRGELNTHYLIHTDAKNFICVICGLGFRTKMAMDSHTLRKHTNLKPSIPCEECGKLFRVRSDLYSHAMTHKARKERIHRCDECNLTFRTDKSLSRHLELHDPTRPLACTKCPLRYKNKDQLVRHVATHEKPDIECELCHRVFGRPDHLKRHIVTKHASLSASEQMYLSETLKKRKQNPRQNQQASIVKTSPTQQESFINTNPGSVTTSLPDSMMISLPPPKEEVSQQRPESELSTVSVVDLETVTTSFTANNGHFLNPSSFIRPPEYLHHAASVPVFQLTMPPSTNASNTNSHQTL